jgi:hypothetical protein
MTGLFGLHGILGGLYWIVVVPYAMPKVSFSSDILLKPRLS